MPEWLVEALKNNPLTEEEKSSVIKSVLDAGEEHSRQTAMMRPTEADRQIRYNM